MFTNKKKLLYSDLSILNNSSDTLEWIEKMKNYFISLGYKEHFESGNESKEQRNSNDKNWKIDEQFMREIMRNHLNARYHKYIRSGSSIDDILKNLEFHLVGRTLAELTTSLSTKRYSHYPLDYTRGESEFNHHLNTIYYNALIFS